MAAVQEGAGVRATRLCLFILMRMRHRSEGAAPMGAAGAAGESGTLCADAR